MSTERRAHARVKVRTPIQILPDTNQAPIFGATTDVSLGGCYVETLFPLAIGTTVEVRLRAGETTVIAVGKVKTCDPQVGNGIEFLRMLPEDRDELKLLVESAEETAGPVRAFVQPEMSLAT